MIDAEREQRGKAQGKNRPSPIELAQTAEEIDEQAALLLADLEQSNNERRIGKISEDNHDAFVSEGGVVATFAGDAGAAISWLVGIRNRLRYGKPEFQPPFVCLIEKTVGALIGVDHRNGAPPELVRLMGNKDSSINLTISGLALEAIRGWPEPSPDLPMSVPHSFFTDPVVMPK